MLLCAKPLLALIELYPMPTMYFFLGAVAGGVPMTVREAGVRRFTWRVPVYIAIGAALVLSMNLLPSDLFGSGAGFLPASYCRAPLLQSLLCCRESASRICSC